MFLNIQWTGFHYLVAMSNFKPRNDSFYAEGYVMEQVDTIDLAVLSVCYFSEIVKAKKI